MHDWVLYRNSSKLDAKEVAEGAYDWLFKEEPGSVSWAQRQAEGRVMTSLVNICEILDLDPEFVREQARKLTPVQIMTAGRPAERRAKVVERPHYAEHGISDHVSISALEESTDNQYSSSYEAHYAVYTSD